MAMVKSKRRKCTTRHRLSRQAPGSGALPRGKMRLPPHAKTESKPPQSTWPDSRYEPSWVKGPQLIKMQEPFAAFKKQLNLPANPVKFQHDIVAGERFRQGGQHTEVAGQAQGRGLGVLPFLAALRRNR